MKIIQINIRPIDGSAFYAHDDERFYTFGMGYLLNDNIAKYCSQEKIELESWRADWTINCELKKTIKNIKIRIFPGKNISKTTFSASMILEMQREALNNKEVIFHFHALHHPLFNLITLILPSRNIVVSHHGGANYSYKRQNNKLSRFRKLRNILFEKIDQYALRKSKFIIPQTDYEASYLEEQVGEHKILRMPVAGIYFDKLQLIEKNDAKRQLGFPIGKKIVMQIGRAVTYRGIRDYLDIYHRLKSREDFYFYCAGIQPSEELFFEVAYSGMDYCGPIDYDQIYLYLNAADILLYLPFEDRDLKFGGTSFLPLEALACGTPTIATTLRHFRDNSIQKYCIVPENSFRLTEMLEELLSRPFDRIKARELVRKYYNWEIIANDYLKIYKSIIYSCNQT